jgi:uncharacterized FlaG/YvyC family protein
MNNIQDSDRTQYGALANTYVQELTAPQARRELVQAVRKLNKADYLLLGEGNELRLAVDPVTKKPVIKAVNRASQQVLFQIPPESALRLAREIRESAEG